MHINRSDNLSFRRIKSADVYKIYHFKFHTGTDTDASVQFSDFIMAAQMAVNSGMN